jgi:hypothetical protein
MYKQADCMQHLVVLERPASQIFAVVLLLRLTVGPSSPVIAQIFKLQVQMICPV